MPASQHYAEIHTSTGLRFHFPACEKAGRQRAPWTKITAQHPPVIWCAAAMSAPLLQPQAPQWCLLEHHPPAAGPIRALQRSLLCFWAFCRCQRCQALALSCTFMIACPPWQEPCQAKVEVLLDLGAAILAMTEQRRFVPINPVNQTGRTVLMELAQDTLEGMDSELYSNRHGLSQSCESSNILVK